MRAFTAAMVFASICFKYVAVDGFRCVRQSIRIHGRPMQSITQKFTSSIENHETLTSKNERSSSEPQQPSDKKSANSKKAVKRKKVRQHVNPLADVHRQPIELSENWLADAYGNPELPFLVDIGCAMGTWARNMAVDNKHMNFLGLEIRKPCVELASYRKEEEKIENLHYLCTNVNINLKRILMEIRRVSDVQAICVQFPDPHFKNAHKKRRAVNTQLVDDIVNECKQNTQIFLQSDIQEMTEYMRDTFLENDRIEVVEGYVIDDLAQNESPFGVQTEREVGVRKNDGNVYRILVRKKE